MNRYFGTAWPDHCKDLMIEMPVGLSPCIFCGEGFTAGDSGVIMADGKPAHWECEFRQVIGSADCQLRGPHPRGTCTPVREGQTKREAAREAVTVFMSRH